MREVIGTPNAPSSPLYSQAVKAGQHIYVSGLVGIDVSTGNLAGSTIQEQTRQSLLNCEAILRAAGATLEDVVEVGVLLTNPTDFAGMNDEYATWSRPSGRLATSPSSAWRSPMSSSRSV
jgi:enamine deaminase RidA (YjgF/YER057c/UK114 family)